MNFKLLDLVALKHAVPGKDLQAGEIGTIVEIYEPDGIEVEFVEPTGATKALLTLRTDDVRPTLDQRPSVASGPRPTA